MMAAVLLVPTLQALAACAAGVALWKGWCRAVDGADPWWSRLVSLGFLFRAAAGIALFWTSYLRLPIASHLILGRGFWRFAVDADGGMQLGAMAASRGLLGIVTLDRRVTSVSFTQLLGLARDLFGGAASLGLLLNCGFFLAGALLLRRWTASAGSPARGAGLFALAVWSLQPSWILWATQPLKDPFFGFLVIAWALASRGWLAASLEATAGPKRTARRLLMWALLLGVVLYELAGIRAYFAVMLWLGLGAAMVLSLLAEATVRRGRRLLVGALTWVLLSQVIVASGAPLLPPFARSLLMPYGRPTRGEAAGTTVDETVVAMRAGFVRSGGSTQIVVGEAGRAAGRPAPEPSAQRMLLPSPSPPPAPAPTAERPAAEGVAATEAAAGWPRRLAAGLAAIFLPRFVGRSVGLFDVAGGGGAWAFAELDTLGFLFAAVLGVLATARAASRAGRLSPLALELLTAAALVAIGLALVVTNFGTLFRLREMVLLPLTLAPLAARQGPSGGFPRASSSDR